MANCRHSSTARLHERYLREAEQLDFTFREHGRRVHPLVVQVDLSRHPKPSRFDILYMMMEILGGIVKPIQFGKPLDLHAQQTDTASCLETFQ